MAFCVIFGAGIIAGMYIPSSARTTYYGVRIQKVVDAHTWKLVSPATGPFVADFCSDVQQYAPKAGYVLCKFQYVDRGCFDIRNKRDGFWWVKGSNDKTTILGPEDTFQPWGSSHQCYKDEPIAQGGQ